jgi:hypothetical protein
VKHLTGKRIKFAEEKVSYKVIAADDYYAICVKPFNLKKTYIYTIVDLQNKMRGPDNLIFGPKFKYDKAEEAKLGLQDLNNGILELSHRRSIPLKIDWVKDGN